MELPVSLVSLIRKSRYAFESPLWALVGFFCRVRREILGGPESLRLEEGNWGTVAVIGRGKSAELICSDPTEFDVAILCNFRDTDLTNEKLVKRLCRTKAIVLLSNIYEPVISCKLLQRLPVSEVVWCGFFDGRFKQRRLPRGRLRAMGFRVKALPRDFDVAWLQGFQKNTGISAIRLASLNSKAVSVFGIEFYSTEHIFATPSDRRGYGISRPDYGQAVKNAFQVAIDDFPETSFKLFATSDHALKARNLTVLSDIRTQDCTLEGKTADRRNRGNLSRRRKGREKRVL